MRILVDSSVWIDFLNGFPSPERVELAKLILGEHDLCTCGVVVAEVFQGLHKDKGRAELSTLFESLIFLEPSGIGLSFRAAEVYRLLRQRGKTIRSTIDCLIAALAEESGCAVLARDRDLETILESGILNAELWSIGHSAS